MGKNRLKVKDLLARVEDRFPPFEVDLGDGEVLRFKNFNQLTPQQQEEHRKRWANVTVEGDENTDPVALIIDTLRFVSTDPECFDRFYETYKDESPAVFPFIFEEWMGRVDGDKGESKP